MRWLLLDLFVFVLSTGVLGQIKVAGRIETNDGKPIPFVKVSLMGQGDASPVTVCTTNESGQYEMDKVIPGKYFLEYAAAGFLTYNSPPFELAISPGSKNAGIIVLNKKEELGTNGSYSLTGGYGMEPKAAMSVGVNHRTRHLNIFGNYSYSYDKTYWATTAKGSFQFPKDIGKGERTCDYLSEDRPVKRVNNANIGLDYQIDRATSIGVNAAIIGSFQTSEGFTRSNYTIYGDSLLLLGLNKHEKDNLLSTINDININRTLGKKSKINFDIAYIYYKDHAPKTYINSFLDKDGNDLASRSPAFFPQQAVMNETKMNALAYKVAYDQQLSSTADLQIGFKRTESKIVNAASVKGLKNGIWMNDNPFLGVIDSSVSGVMTMKQPVNDVYSSFGYDVNKTRITVGLDYEYFTSTINYDVNTGGSFHRRYSNFLPSVSIKRKISGAMDAELTYNRTIRRPSYNDIATNVALNDIYGITISNPLLTPVISDNLLAQLRYKECQLLLLFNRAQNAIVTGQQTESLTDSVFYQRAHNLRYQESLTMQVSFPIQVTSWWRMENSFTGAWNQFATRLMPRENFINTNLTNNYLTYGLSSIQKFILFKGLLLDLSAVYNSDSWWGSYREKGYGVLSIEVRKSLKKNGLLQLSVPDLFESAHDHSFLDLPHLAYNIHSNLDTSPESRKSRIVKLSYYRSFGNDKIKGRRKWDMAAQDERNRLNNLD